MNPDETTPPSDDMTLEEAVATLLPKLPRPVQEFLVSPERPALTLKLTRKYNLHADQAGAFERAFIFMLLGIATPEEFVKDLEEENISEEAIQALARDINEEVFIKLRNAERSDPSRLAPAPQPVQPAATPAITYIQALPAEPAASQTVPPPAYTAPARVEEPSVSQFSDTFSPIAPQAVNPEEMPLPRSAQPVVPPANIPTFTPTPIQAPAAATSPAPGTTPVHEIVHARTMQEDMRMAQMAQAAQIAQPIQQNPQPVQGLISVMPPAASVKVPATPPPVPPSTPVPQQPVITPVMQQNANRDALHAVLKEYGVDPYREPPE